MEKIVIFRSLFDGQPLFIRLAMFVVAQAVNGVLCLPAVFEEGIETAAFWIALALFVMVSVFTFLIFFQSKAIDLVPSSPPVVITTITWFGKFATVEEETLEGAAWVQVSHNLGGGESHPPYLTVEIVQPGRWATVTSKHEDSPEGLELAKQKCAELAVLLGLKDLGYRG